MLTWRNDFKQFHLIRDLLFNLFEIYSNHISLHPTTLSLPYTHSISISLQKRAGLPGTPNEHGIRRYDYPLGTLPHAKAG